MSGDASRIKVERGERSFRIVVRSAGGGEAWLRAAFLIAAVIVAVLTLARIGRAGVAASGTPSQLLAPALVTALFGLGAAAMGYKVVWQLFGREEITATPELTTIASRALGLGRRLTVKTSEIKRVEWADVPLRWARGWRRSVFVELEGQRIELRSQLSLVEANQLRTEIWEQIQSLQRLVGDQGYRS